MMTSSSTRALIVAIAMASSVQGMPCTDDGNGGSTCTCKTGVNITDSSGDPIWDCVTDADSGAGTCRHLDHKNDLECKYRKEGGYYCMATGKFAQDDRDVTKYLTTFDGDVYSTTGNKGLSQCPTKACAFNNQDEDCYCQCSTVDSGGGDTCCKYSFEEAGTTKYGCVGSHARDFKTGKAELDPPVIVTTVAGYEGVCWLGGQVAANGDGDGDGDEAANGDYKTVRISEEGSCIRVADPCDPMQADPIWTAAQVKVMNFECGALRSCAGGASALGTECTGFKGEVNEYTGSCLMKYHTSAEGVTYAMPYCKDPLACDDVDPEMCPALIEDGGPLASMAGFGCPTAVQALYDDVPEATRDELGDINPSMLRGRYSDYCPVTCDTCDTTVSSEMLLGGMEGTDGIAEKFANQLCVLFGYMSPQKMVGGDFDGETWGCPSKTTCPFLGGVKSSTTLRLRALGVGRLLANDVALQVEAVLPAMKQLERKLVAEDDIGLANAAITWPNGSEALGLSIVGNSKVTATITVDREGEDMGLGYMNSIIIIAVGVLCILCCPVALCIWFCCCKKKKVNPSA